MNSYRWAIGATMALVCLGLAPRSPPRTKRSPRRSKPLSRWRKSPSSTRSKTRVATLCRRCSEASWPADHQPGQGGEGLSQAQLQAAPVRDRGLGPGCRRIRARGRSTTLCSTSRPRQSRRQAKPEEKEPGDESGKNAKQPAVKENRGGQVRPAVLRRQPRHGPDQRRCGPPDAGAAQGRCPLAGQRGEHCVSSMPLPCRWARAGRCACCRCSGATAATGAW